MRNSYPGTCYRCGLMVPAGKGHFQRHQGGWRVHHHNYGTAGGMTCDKAKKVSDAGRLRTTTKATGTQP